MLAVSKGPQGQFRYGWWSSSTSSSHGTDFDHSETASPEDRRHARLLRVPARTEMTQSSCKHLEGREGQ